MLNRIKALLAKTTENGCTEAEAFAAILKARQLMDEHNVSLSDLQDEPLTEQRQRVRNTNRIKRALAQAISQFCECRAWKAAVNTSSSDIVFFGYPQDVQLADWMLETLAGFVERQRDQYLATLPTVDKFHRNGFEVAATNRLSERLKELAPKPPITVPIDGKSLMVTKQALITEGLAKKGIRFSQSRARRVNCERDAMDAGRAAGNAATIARPIDASFSPKMLGGSR
jgi:hypothetical protein